jgi:sugar-specific transcriptional regulator TrmB
MIEELRQLGLTEYEARVYSALLKLKTATGGQIAGESKVPHGKTYESLRSLSEKGLITILSVEPKIFKLIDPKIGIKNLIERKITSFEENGKATLGAIEKIEMPRKEEAIEKLEIYSGGVQKQYELASQLMDATKKQIVVISKGERMPPSVFRKINQLVSKGIDYRLIVFQFNGNREWVKKFLDNGVKVRHFKTGEFTLVIRDKEEVLLVIRNPKNPEDRINLLFRDTAIAAAMAVYFETIWKQAKPIRL